LAGLDGFRIVASLKEHNALPTIYVLPKPVDSAAQMDAFDFALEQALRKEQCSHKRIEPQLPADAQKLTTRKPP
jgi:hypothetical protein